MRLAKAALANPHLVVVAVLGVVLIGVVVLFSQISVDILPVFKTPAVQILTLYPGMPAEVMERDIMSRLERWTGQSNGIAAQEGRAMLGVCVVRDYFRSDIDPNTAMSQVTSLAISDLYYLPPGTIPPMVMPFDPTAPIPLCLLSVSSPVHDETQLYDIAYFDLRNRLQGITGVIAPAVYGGRLRRILAYVDRERLQARNLSPMDVVRALKNFNTMIPTGNAKFGDLDYQIDANGMVPRVEELNDIPVKIERGAPVFVKDVGRAEDAQQIQTNVVRVNGRRQLYIPIYRQPGANTIDVVNGVKQAVPAILSRLPSGVRLDVVADQSVYVRGAIGSLVTEGVLGAALAAAMILVFLRNVRATFIIGLSIPLSILAAFIGLFFTGNSVNAMTLGGLALAVGRLVDDSIVVLENTARHLAMGRKPFEAAFEAAGEVAMPVLVATITTIAVFFPVVFLFGMGKFLFTPLALAVAFSMIASYLVALTWVPVCCASMLQGAGARGARAGAEEAETGGWIGRLQAAYARLLAWALARRGTVIAGIGALCAASAGLWPLIGQELFPQVDAGQFTVRVRAPSGTRIERTEEIVKRVEDRLRDEIPKEDLAMLISNIGILYDWPAAYTPNAGPMDAFVQVQLTEGRRRSAQEVARLLRARLNPDFPDVELAYETGGILTAALNFGLPAPINIQIEGNKLDVSRAIAERIRGAVEKVPGAVDVRIQQRIDYPQIAVDIDRVKAALSGLTAVDIVKNLVTILNSSVNFDPAFWIDAKSGNHYFIGAQYRERDIRSPDTLLDLPLTAAGNPVPVPLRTVAKLFRRSAPAEINHYRLNRVIDVYAAVDGRDIGSVAADIARAIAPIEEDVRKNQPGYFIRMRGEVQSMRESFQSLGFGFLFAAALVYLVMVAQFRSFLDPFIIMFAVPLGVIGVLAILAATGTSLNIQSFLGTIFMVGIAVSNSILIVEFANRLRERGLAPAAAAVEAGRTRLRPILMTSIAAILGLLPMAFRLGEGAEANVPLARAVIGGLGVSTLLTLVVVPVLYSLFKREAAGTARG